MTATEAQLGNEPSFDIPWEYDYVGAPDRRRRSCARCRTQSDPAAAKQAPYVQSMTVDGQAWNNAYLPASLFHQGGTVD